MLKLVDAGELEAEGRFMLDLAVLVELGLVEVEFEEEQQADAELLKTYQEMGLTDKELDEVGAIVEQQRRWCAAAIQP